MARSAFGIVAATLNRGEPVGAWPRRVTVLPESANGPETAEVSLRFNTSEGLRWGGFDLTGSGIRTTLAGGPVFALELNDKRYDSTDWKVVGVETSVDRAKIIDLRLEGDGPELDARLRVKRDQTSGGVELRLELANRGESQMGGAAGSLRFPILEGLSIGNPPDTWYLFTGGGGMISNRDANRTHRSRRGQKEIWNYSDRKPMQMDGFFHPESGAGIMVSTDDPRALPRIYELTRDASVGVGYEIDYTPWQLGPGERWISPPTRLESRSGGWRAMFEAYRERRPVPEQAHGNPQLDRAFLLVAPPIWRDNFRTDVLEGTDALYGVNWVHLYGWSFRANDTESPKSRAILEKGPPSWKIWRQWGVYDDLSKYGGAPAFRRDVRDYIHNRFQAGVSYYTDPYLYDVNWDERLERHFRSLPQKEKAEIVARYNRRFNHSVETMNQARLLELWSARGPNGNRKGSHGAGASFCLAQPGAYRYVMEQISGVGDLVGPEAIYIDESTRVIPSKACYASQHDHPPGNIIQEFRGFMAELRKRVPAHIALLTEYAPPDVIAPYQNGALGHTTAMGTAISPNFVRSGIEAASPHLVDRPIEAEVTDGVARIPLELGPRSVGCVVRHAR
jgi:hypothetical protein